MSRPSLYATAIAKATGHAHLAEERREIEDRQVEAAIATAWATIAIALKETS